MKIRMIIFAFMLLPFMVSAQSRAVQKFFDTYDEREDFTLIDIKGNLLNMLSEKKDKNSRTKITGIQLLSAPKGKAGVLLSDVKSLEQKIKNESFEDLMTIRDKDSHINFMMDERSGIIKELIMVINSKENFTIMSLVGDIPVEELERLGDEVEIEGLDHLKKRN